MEFLGFQQALSVLPSTEMVITSFISDRHAGIAKWMREECPLGIVSSWGNQQLTIIMTVGM